MRLFDQNETLLEMVEMYAEEVGGISSEEMLSDSFDALLSERSADALYELENDSVMLSEAFSAYVDALCKDGCIHIEQYNNYEYVGRFA